jgi:T5SS/PEP-CTERM-associated repeat protein
VGAGTLNVTRFGTLRAPRLQLGVATTGQGTVTLSEQGAVLIDNVLLVGVEGMGTLVIDDGVVTTGVLGIASDGAALPSTVTVAGFLSRLSIREGVDIGSREDSTFGPTPGALRISEGAVVNVDGTSGFDLNLRDGIVQVEGAHDAIQPSRLEVMGGLVVTGGNLEITNGALVEAREADVVAQTPTGSAVAAVRGATMRVDEVLQIATPTERPGTLVLDANGLVEVGTQLLCGRLCEIRGIGTVRVGDITVDPGGGTVRNLGQVSPGNSPGALRIEGTLVQEASATLVMEAAGVAPGQFDVLEVTRQATLGGTLDVRFLDGFLPKQGDVLPFLTVGGETTGDFDAVRVHGVAPGFDFTIGATGGAVTLTAVKDAQAAACADPGDADADGHTCADTCPVVANAEQADADGDLVGDACDPCLRGVAIAKSALKLKRGKLSFKGQLRFTVAPALDPTANGARLVVQDAVGQTLVDLVAPAGAFDKATRQGWTNRGFRSRTGPVRAVKLAVSKRTPEVVAMALKGRVGSLDANAIKQPIAATILLDASATPASICGEARFTGPPPVNPACAVRRGALACNHRKRR